MIETAHLPIRQPQEAYIFKYPIAAELAEKQRSIFWTAEEIGVENDKQDFLVNMTEAEKHAIITTLKLFTIYELILGGEVWGDRLFHAYPRPETQMMCNAFSFAELNIHAPFYAKLNQSLMIDTEEFYLSYKNDPVLSERINFVHSAVGSEDLLFSIAAFTLMENCVLYSNFSFLKHFQSQGKDMLKNVVAGINFSAKDENLHATGGAWLFNQTLEEARASSIEVSLLHAKIQEVAANIYEHESRIIDMLFEKGDIAGINAEDMREFVKSRINLTLENMNIDPIFEVDGNPIAEWFYHGITGTSFHDFFQITGNSYNRVWNEDSFDFTEEEFDF